MVFLAPHLGRVAMPYDALVYQVMIASPSDIVDERKIFREIIHEWNDLHSLERRIVLMPAGWETHSAPVFGERPQETINKQVLENSDLLVAVFWTRLGTPTGKAESGTIEEIDRHVQAGKPAMVYFSHVPLPPGSMNNDQWAKLQQFKESCKTRALFTDYRNIEEFKENFRRQLEIIINTNDYFKNDVGPSLSSLRVEEPLSEEAKYLLIEAAKDPNGNILMHRAFGGLGLQVNKKKFTEPGNPRAEARWEAALEELINGGFVKPYGDQGVIFKITDAGYRLADRFEKNGK
jgi:hypothetical protein